MGQIKVEINCDSLAPSNKRLTTFVLTYPRIIHSELLTHRVFSRNSSSSRAIPVLKEIKEVEDNPFIPKIFYKNQKGMQGFEPCEDQESCRIEWLKSRDYAVEQAKALVKLNVHKQHANRILEPFSFITVVVTSTTFDNFFALRNHRDAQPEIKELAELMINCFQSSIPDKLNAGEWHLPFINNKDLTEVSNYIYYQDQSLTEEELLIKTSVAKCARSSYKNHDGSNTTCEQNLSLYNRLIEHTPLHASPAEHQAMAIGDPNVKSGNFTGWIQYRQCLPNQNVEKYENL